ncbi:hypothetical protein EYF80_018183 [Liparis tanakae]|uniref:Uncharacterized protein n=1 Tax=Liparis tanakae TaxID=230148 RepID=A0A4Z2I171_9TELE|nr:hypothetical protein EYF80_018183 [Liparis tanakae]
MLTSGASDTTKFVRPGRTAEPATRYNLDMASLERGPAPPQSSKWKTASYCVTSPGGRWGD